MASLWLKITDIFSRNKNGVVPKAPEGEGTTKFLREDGQWAEPSGGGGDIPTKLSELENDMGFIDKDESNLTNYYDKTTSDGKYALINSIPTKVSDLNNDSGFITKAVNDLINYYTKTEVNNLIGAINQFNVEIVQTLPTSNINPHTIYMVPKQDGQETDVYDEFIYINNKWELIGNTAIDLTDYYTKNETDELLEDKVDKVDGKGLSTNDYTDADKTKLNSLDMLGFSIIDGKIAQTIEV